MWYTLHTSAFAAEERRFVETEAGARIGGEGGSSHPRSRHSKRENYEERPGMVYLPIADEEAVQWTSMREDKEMCMCECDLVSSGRDLFHCSGVFLDTTARGILDGGQA